MAGSAAAEAKADPVHATLKATGAFVWEHVTSIVAISVAWLLLALPIVTVGPATVGAYRAILSLRESGRVDLHAVAETVRSQFVHASLLGLLPVVLVAMSATYAATYVRTGRLLAGLLALGGANVTIYLGLVLVPTFVGLARGLSVDRAVSQGYLWTARHGAEAISLGIVTVVFLALSSLLTVAMVLIFAGATFAFHVEYVVGDESRTIEPTPATQPQP